MLCVLGCNQSGIFQRKNGLFYCATHNSKCPAVKAKIGKANSAFRTGKTYEEIYGENAEKIRQSRSKSSSNRICSEETRKKRSISIKKSRAENPITPWNKGLKGVQVPWNKGLKKKELPEIIDREDPIYSDFKKYRNRVSVRTRINYKLHESTINPLNYKIGKCGIKDAYQIDHIITVRQGFEQQIPVEIIASPENLRVIPWLENVKKYDGKGVRKNSRKDYD